MIIIAGPTAVGKTAIAIHIARHLGTEIISADSRQCFKELNIGVARPSTEELAMVKHHFIATHSIHDKVTAASFETYALNAAEKIFQQHDVAVMVGGTGLYIKAFTDGMDEIPEVPANIHHEVVTQYNAHGITWLQEQLKQHDGKFYREGEMLNPQRMMRALEVMLSNGQSVLDYHGREKKKRDFEVIKIALDLPRETLYGNINNRVEQMMEKGLEEEARSLLPYQNLNALQTVGYRELFSFFNGDISKEQAVEDIKKHTRHYAKRQLTWFRKDPEYRWAAPDSKHVLQLFQEGLGN